MSAETDAISYTRGVLDGIKKERERIKAEVDKLTELTDSETEVILEKGFDISTKPESLEHIQRIIQLRSTKKQLLALMGE